MLFLSSVWARAKRNVLARRARTEAWLSHACLLGDDVMEIPRRALAVALQAERSSGGHFGFFFTFFSCLNPFGPSLLPRAPPHSDDDHQPPRPKARRVNSLFCRCHVIAPRERKATSRYKASRKRRKRRENVRVFILHKTHHPVPEKKLNKVPRRDSPSSLVT